MCKRIVLVLFLLGTVVASARDSQENWLEIRSQHFTVYTNASEKSGKHVADQFERMRAAFHAAFPQLPMENGSAIVVLAVKDEKDMRALEPEVYLAKGQLKLAGLFLRVPDKNYVLMRVDAEGDHPYSVIYHEYTHFLLGKTANWLPLWLNEGLAEFYQNMDIRDKEVITGEASAENIYLLRQSQMLPVTTLLTVDHSSPYYHEENKGNIFYAESWALTHYLFLKDGKEKTQHLIEYASLVSQNVDSVTAATRALGDLKQLQLNLENYIRQGSFYDFKYPSAAADAGELQIRALTPAQAEAIRADFLVHNQRIADARPMLEHVLQQDPQNVSAHETMGYLEYREGHIDEARKWYEKAAKLDSQSYLAHYYFASMAMNDSSSSGEDDQIESSLRAAIKLNPLFAPAYDRLAVFYGMRHRNLDDARILAFKAIDIDPGNINYRMTAANVFVQMHRVQDAEAVLRTALQAAQSSEQRSMVQSFLDSIRASEGHTNAGALRIAKPDEQKLPEGPHAFVTGTLQNVHCNSRGLDLIVAGEKNMKMHSSNYFEIVFTTRGFELEKELNPCRDLEARPAKIEYVQANSAGAVSYEVVSIELQK